MNDIKDIYLMYEILDTMWKSAHEIRDEVNQIYNEYKLMLDVVDLVEKAGVTMATLHTEHELDGEKGVLFDALSDFKILNKKLNIEGKRWIPSWRFVSYRELKLNYDKAKKIIDDYILKMEKYGEILNELTDLESDIKRLKG